jgi:hypothetical protein
MRKIIKIFPQLLGSILTGALVVLLLTVVSNARTSSIVSTSLDATLNQSTGLPSLPQADVQLPVVPAPVVTAPVVPTAPASQLTSCEPDGYPVPTGIATSFAVGKNLPTADQWVSVARAAKAQGFTGNCLVMAIGIARAESRFVSNARNFNGAPETCDFSQPDLNCAVDRGTWQFNSYWHPEVSTGCADDVNCAAKELWRVTGHGKSWVAWCSLGSNYSNCTTAPASDEALRKYVPEARLAAQQVGAWP